MIYFAYGSNMDIDQMEDRCGEGSFELIGKGKLENYKFIINGRGVATIVPSKDSVVYGLCFEVNDDCLKKLDCCEGHPRIYDRKKLKITTNKEELSTWIYIDSNNISVGKPRDNYLEKIIKAAKKFKIPDDYIKYLKKFRK
jgi:gamma-glutamylcyclotransferase (GGCT)/AIG2-like uncharacterized protein YtfP